MVSISMSEIRLKLSELANRVMFGGERIVVEKNNKPLFAMVSMEDVELLERLEDAIDVKAAEEALKEGDFVPWEEVRKQLKIKHQKSKGKMT